MAVPYCDNGIESKRRKKTLNTTNFERYSYNANAVRCALLVDTRQDHDCKQSLSTCTLRHGSQPRELAVKPCACSATAAANEQAAYHCPGKRQSSRASLIL
jgi:hypothetical protein